MFRPSRRSRADRFRPVASQPVAGSAAGGIPPALRHRALHGAGAPARRARRSAQRPVFAGRAAVFLHHRRAAVRRERNPARHAAAAVARSLSAAQTRADYPPWLQEIVLRCLEIEPVWRYPTASQLAFDLGPSRPGQADRAVGAAAARSAQHGLAPPLQRRPDAAASRNPMSRRNWRRARSWRSRSTSRRDRAELNEALRVTAAQMLATLPSARLACLNVLKLGRVTIDRTLDEQGNNKHIDRLVALRHWASAAEAR